MALVPTFPLADSALSCASLLGSTYRRLDLLCQPLCLEVATAGVSAGEGWVDGAQLVRPDVLDAYVDAEAGRIRDRHAYDAPRYVVASRALRGHLRSVCLLLGGPWYLERRVPRIRLRDVGISLTTKAVRVVPRGFVCLPDDSAADLPGARVVEDEEALRAVLRTAVADHVRPLLAALGPQLRRGPRALWGMVGDDLISGIWYLGRVLGQEDHAMGVASELLPGPIPPFPGGADFRRLVGREEQLYPTRTRLGCCLYYAIPPGRACSTCPRTCDAERLRRFEEDSSTQAK